MTQLESFGPIPARSQSRRCPPYRASFLRITAALLETFQSPFEVGARKGELFQYSLVDKVDTIYLAYPVISDRVSFA